MAKSLGFFGEAALEQVSLAMARGSRGLAATFERLIDRT
jgi:hypothetical protein